MYATSLIFPSGLANRLQIFAMSKEFAKVLGDDYILGGKRIVLSEAGFRIINFDESRSFKLALKYLRFIKANAIEEVYCREPRLLFFLILYNKIIFHLPIKFIYEVHTIFKNTFVDLVVDWFLARMADRFVFLTEHLAARYEKRYRLHYRPANVAPDGVDLSIFDIKLSKNEAKEKLGFSPESALIGYFGRFTTMDQDKGILDILKAMKDLPQNVRFLGVGGHHSDVDYYESLARSLGVSQKIILKGHVPQHDLALYHKASDILLMPFPWSEHYAYYMSPMKMFEYMASRRPIIATNLPSIREVLNDKNASLISPDDPKALSSAITKLLDDPSYAESLANQAYRDVQNYTWEKRTAKILSWMAKA